MLYIQKRKPSDETEEAIERVRRDNDWNSIDKRDIKKVRSVFDQVDKAILRSSLIDEQRGLCAYCMCRINNDHHTTIEHLKPLELYGELALDYTNLMACCDGGRTTYEHYGERVLCCDASKGNKEITISPYDHSQMQRIRYNKEGRIYVFPKDENLETDINQTLHLNGSLDNTNNMIADTSTNLVFNRKQIYRNYAVFIEGLNKHGKNVRAALMHRVREIQESEMLCEYAGVWLYFLNRKLRQM